MKAQTNLQFDVEYIELINGIKKNELHLTAHTRLANE